MFEKKEKNENDECNAFEKVVKVLHSPIEFFHVVHPLLFSFVIVEDLIPAHNAIPHT